VKGMGRWETGGVIDSVDFRPACRTGRSLISDVRLELIDFSIGLVSEVVIDETPSVAGAEMLAVCSELVIGMGVATGRGEVEGETGGMGVAWCSTS